MITFATLLKNTKKTKENQPDYRLTTKIGDKYIELGAGWVKTSAGSPTNPTGTKFISIKFKDGVTVDYTPPAPTQEQNIDTGAIPF